MKKTVILIISILLSITGFSQVELTLHVDNAGQLFNKIQAAGNTPQEIQKLILSGELNGTDIRLLRKMGGTDEKGNQTAGYQLSVLNLKDARIVEGGDHYYQFKTYIGNGNYETHYIETNGHRIREYTFIHCRNLTEITIPDSITYIGKSAFENCGKLSLIYLPNEVNIIEPNAFYACQSLTTFMVPDSVTTIGSDAFRGSGLTSITIPEKVSYIGNAAFAYCKRLASVDIPANVKTIEPFTFLQCDSLTSFEINDSITSIGQEAFRNSGLTSISIPKSVSFVGNAAFGNCPVITAFNIDPENNSYASVDGVFFDKAQKKLIQYPIGNTRTEYTVPATVDSIYNYAFANCVNLTTVTLSEGITSIGDFAFHKCSNISTLSIPNSVTSIGADAFSYCSKIDSVNIPLGVKTIKNNTFKYCEKIKSVTLPYTVLTIGDEAFAYCSELTNISLSGNLQSIGYGSFLDCVNLTEIYSKNEVPPTVPNSFTFGNVNRNTCKLYVPNGSKTDYQNASVWNEFLTILEADLATTVNNNEHSRIKIYTKKSTVIVEGIPPQTLLSVYTIAGALIHRSKSYNCNTSINLKSGIYVVHAGTKKVKVVL